MSCINSSITESPFCQMILVRSTLMRSNTHLDLRDAHGRMQSPSRQNRFRRSDRRCSCSFRDQTREPACVSVGEPGDELSDEVVFGSRRVYEGARQVSLREATPESLRGERQTDPPK